MLTGGDTGKITLGDDGEDEYQINSEFVDDTLRVAEELDLDELEAARLLLDAAAEDDAEIWGRPLWACGVIRFHQERRFLLDCMRLLIEIAADEDIDDDMRDIFGGIVEERVYRVPPPGSAPQLKEDKIVPKCMSAMPAVRQMLQGIGERMTAKSLLAQASLLNKLGDSEEVYEYARISLVEQHELLAVILSAAIEKRHADVGDFKEFIGWLKKADKYDHLLGRFALCAVVRKGWQLTASQFTCSPFSVLLSRSLGPRWGSGIFRWRAISISWSASNRRMTLG